MNIEQDLIQTFSTSFVVYYKAHAAHWNTMGRNFYSDHKLLNKIYDDIFESVDDIAEIARTLKLEIPSTLTDIIADSQVSDSPIYDDGDGDEYLQAVYDDIETLIDVFHALEEVTDTTEYSHINNFAQDRVRTLQKFCWMLRSTLSSRNPESEQY
jgi:starvation-inducible DNA-binding protein